MFRTLDDYKYRLTTRVVTLHAMNSTKPISERKSGATSLTLRWVLLGAALGFVLPILYLTRLTLVVALPTSLWWLITGETGEKGQAFAEIISMSLDMGLPGAAVGALVASILETILQLLRSRSRRN